MNNNLNKYTKVPKGKNQYLDQYVNAIRKTISNSKSTSLKLNNKSKKSPKKSNPFAKNVVGIYNYGGLKYKIPTNTKRNAKWMSPFIKNPKTISRKKKSLEDNDSFPFVKTQSKLRRK